jgi:hypothetical protein
MYKNFLDELSSKILLCNIKNGNFFHIVVVKLKNEKIYDLILNKYVEITSENLLSYESWSSDINENNQKLLTYVTDISIKLNFFKNCLPSLDSKFCEDFILSTNRIDFIKKYFNCDLNSIRKFKRKLIESFCDTLIEQLSTVKENDVKCVLDGLRNIKLDNINHIQDIDVMISYWPDILYPDPFQI